MRKKVLLLSILLISFLMINIFVVMAEETSEMKIDKAYDCLKQTIENKTCSELTLEQKTFSLLSVGKCKTELINDSKNNSECWPEASCKLKETAQAILALDNLNVDTDKAKNWLLFQNATPQNLDWYLEIESPKATTCTISSFGFSYEINIDKDRKITSDDLGNCLTLAYSDYWLEINPNCYDKEFEISCDESFLSTLIFKKQGSSTYQLLSEVNSESAGGITTEKINSLCFKQGTECNYEGSLWAVFALDSLGEDVSSYLPYLIINSDENQKYLPDAFLYYLTNEVNYQVSLLSKQKSSQYWLEDTDKFYDTALALYPFKYIEAQEKTDSINWLLGVQEESGCWQGGIRNTAFILYSIWPRTFGGYNGGENGGDNGGDETSCINDSDCFGDEECINNICIIVDNALDCRDEGGFCMSSMKCDSIGGSELDYTCDGVYVCCDTEIVLESCEILGGEICSSEQTCTGREISSSDTTDYKTCCYPTGNCETYSPTTNDEYDCEEHNGTCKSTCGDAEEESWIYNCEDSLDYCCMKKPIEKHNYWFVWVLLVLIFLIVLAVIFRDKLKEFWFKLKLGSGRSKPRPQRPGFPLFNQRPIRSSQRRILPQKNSSKKKFKRIK